MDEIMEELEAAQTKLRALDERRAGQLAYRDDLIVRALAAGNTWAKVQTRTGLTPRAVTLAIKRHG